MAGFYGPNGRLHGRKPIVPKPPSQASGQAPRPTRPGQPGTPIGNVDKKIKNAAKKVGNALLPGNPFG